MGETGLVFVFVGLFLIWLGFSVWINYEWKATVKALDEWKEESSKWCHDALIELRKMEEENDRIKEGVSSLL